MVSELSVRLSAGDMGAGLRSSLAHDPAAGEVESTCKLPVGFSFTGKQGHAKQIVKSRPSLGNTMVCNQQWYIRIYMYTIGHAARIISANLSRSQSCIVQGIATAQKIL